MWIRMRLLIVWIVLLSLHQAAEKKVGTGTVQTKEKNSTEKQSENKRERKNCEKKVAWR